MKNFIARLMASVSLITGKGNRVSIPEVGYTLLAMYKNGLSPSQSATKHSGK